MRIRSVAVALLPFVAACLAACDAGSAPQPFVRLPGEGDLPDEAAFLAEVDRTSGTRDSFEFLHDPVLVAADGPHGVAPDEIVLGLDLGATQVAYPIQLLNFHEAVEHTVDGLELLACW